MEFETVICTVDQPNARGIIHPRHVAESIIAQYKEKSVTLGELGYPNDLTIHLDNVSHSIDDLWIEGDCLKAKIRVLKTPMGDKLQEMLEAGTSVSFGIAGAGIPTETNVRPDDFTLAQIHGILDENV